MAHLTASRTLPKAGRSNVSFVDRVRTLLAVRRQRRALAELPDHLRRDVGLSEADIEREARRRLWDVPDHWRF